MNTYEIIATVAVALVLIEIRLGTIRRRLPDKRVRLWSR